MPAGAVYVGRPSRRGNPFRVDTTVCLSGDRLRVSSRRLAVALFEWWLSGAQFTDIAAPPSREVILAGLRGRDLACWCRLDQPCHANVLLHIANEEVPHA